MGYQVEVSGPDRPALICLRVDAQGRRSVERTLGVALPHPSGLARRAGRVAVLGLGPDEWLVRVAPDEEESWLARLTEVTAGTFSAVVLVSDAWRVFTLSGPESSEVLAQATEVDLHPPVCPTGRAVRTAFARITALIHRLDARPSFDVYVDTSLARYAGRWLE